MPVCPHPVWRFQGRGPAVRRRQVAFEIVKGVKFAGAARARPAIRYFADFVYQERGQQVIEDIKSPATANLPAFKLKRHLMLALLGLEVRVTA